MTSTASLPADQALAGRGLLLVSAAGIIWGTIGPAVALVDDASDLTPATITAYRSVLAVATLLAAAVATRQIGVAVALVRARPLRTLAVGALTAAFQLLFFVAVIGAGVSVATVVMLGFAPALLLVVHSLRRRRLPAATQAITVGTAIVGLALVALVGESGPRPDGLWFGLAAALGAGTAYALSAEFSGPLSRNHGTIAVTSATMTVAAAILIPVGAVSALVSGTGMAPESSRVWLLIGYLGVVTMALAYALLFAGLRTTPSSAAVIATLLEPVTAVAIAVAFLGEGLTWAGVAGSTLILVSIASLGGRKAPQPQ